MGNSKKPPTETDEPIEQDEQQEGELLEEQRRYTENVIELAQRYKTPDSPTTSPEDDDDKPSYMLEQWALIITPIEVAAEKVRELRKSLQERVKKLFKYFKQ